MLKNRKKMLRNLDLEHYLLKGGLKNNCKKRKRNIFGKDGFENQLT